MAFTTHASLSEPSQSNATSDSSGQIILTLFSEVPDTDMLRPLRPTSTRDIPAAQASWEANELSQCGLLFELLLT